MMTSASEKPLSISPFLCSRVPAILEGFPSNWMWSCRIGASGFIASSISMAHGKTSYSTSINSHAFSAISSVVAATAASGWPWKRTLSLAITFLHIHRISWIPSITGVSIGKSTISLDVITALTPSNSSAFFVLIDKILACGWGLLNTWPQIIPGIVVSDEYWARPVTLSAPSGLIVFLPIHLLLISQIPHWSAAFSRNFCCKACNLPPSDIPSIVSMLLPSASAANIRQEHTSSPSNITLHEPQSPEPQLSLEPVRFNWFLKTFNIVSCGSHKYSTFSLLIFVETWIFAISLISSNSISC